MTPTEAMASIRTQPAPRTRGGDPDKEKGSVSVAICSPPPAGDDPGGSAFVVLDVDCSPHPRG
ncbi:hypothetical protein [Streptomyces goshikiensis]